LCWKLIPNERLNFKPSILDSTQTASHIAPETKEKTKEGTGEVMRATTLLFHVKINSIADCYT
jgi:hypothetical protein